MAARKLTIARLAYPKKYRLRLMHTILAMTFLVIAGPFLEAQEQQLHPLLVRSREPKEHLLLQAKGGPISQISFSSDGTTLAACCAPLGRPMEIHVWSTTTGKQKSSLACPSPNSRLAISRDHKLAAIWPMNRNSQLLEAVVVWDLETSKQRILLKHAIYGDNAEFLADGKTLMTFANGPGAFRLWDLQTGTERSIDPLRWHFEIVLAPDRSILATSEGEGS
jgi:WD40 repeat protein